MVPITDQRPVASEQTAIEKRTVARRGLGQQTYDQAFDRNWRRARGAGGHMAGRGVSLGDILAGLALGAAGVVLWSELRRSLGEEQGSLPPRGRSRTELAPKAYVAANTQPPPAAPTGWSGVGFRLLAPHQAVLDLSTCEGTSVPSKATEVLSQIWNRDQKAAGASCRPHAASR